jgi:hypothetical protein
MREGLKAATPPTGPGGLLPSSFPGGEEADREGTDRPDQRSRSTAAPASAAPGRRARGSPPRRGGARAIPPRVAAPFSPPQPTANRQQPVPRSGPLPANTPAAGPVLLRSLLPPAPPDTPLHHRQRAASKTSSHKDKPNRAGSAAAHPHQAASRPAAPHASCSSDAMQFGHIRTQQLQLLPLPVVARGHPGRSRNNSIKA